MIVGAAALNAVSALNNSIPALSNNTENPQPGHFSSLVANALQDVSAQQSAATSAESDYAAGVPGATLGKALVASDRATVAWNATVAVRNEVVSAYQSIMNMQF